MAFKPFPTTELEISLLLNKLSEELPNLMITLGLAQAEIDQLTADAENFAYIVQFASNLNDRRESFTDFKTMLFWDENGPLPNIPGFNSVNLPAAGLHGIIPRAKALIKYIKAHPNFTESMGELLDLIVDNANDLQPGDILPTLKLKAQNDENLEIGFSRQGLDAIRIDYREKGSQDWLLAGIFTSSPAIHEVPYDIPKAPKALEYRAILLKKNQPVSQFSTTHNIVTTP